MGRAAPKGAVGKNLIAADAAAPRGVVQRRRTRRDRGVDAAADQDRVGRERGLVQQELHRERLEAARGAGGPFVVGLEDHTGRGDAAGRQAGERRPGRLAQALEIRRGHGAEQPLRGGLEAGPGRRAGRIALDPAARRVGRRRGDPRGGERAAVADAAVTVAAPSPPAAARRRPRPARLASADAARRDPRPGAGGPPASRRVRAGRPRRAAGPGARRSSARRAGRRSGRSRAGGSGAGGCR